MNESFTQFPPPLRTDERISLSYQRGIELNLHENRRNEAFFADALHQVASEAWVDWDRYESERYSHPRSNCVVFPYRLKLLASVITACQKLPSERIERQLYSAIAQLAREPRPSHSLELSLEGELSDWQPRQIELDAWRILYIVNETEREAIIVAIVQQEDNFFNHYLSARETYLFNDPAHILGNWEYHYC